jgi:hypothetical protein
MKTILLASAAVFMAAQCQAATINVIAENYDQQANCMRATVDVRGDLISGDTDRFRAATAKYDCATVWFHSNGGEPAVGVNIGQEIRAKKYYTGVASWAKCLSSCALVWVAGVRRYVVQGGNVGFHAIYWDDGSGYALTPGADECYVSSSGNAAVGAYLGRLGFSYKAIRWMTAASPASMNWLSPGTAAEYEIP